MPRSKKELAKHFAVQIARLEKPAPPKRTPKRVRPANLVARRTNEFEILDLRRRSMSYEDISAIMVKRDPTLTPTRCCNIVREILANARINYTDKIEDAREIEVRKLDMVEGEVYKILQRGKAPIKLMAVDRVLKIGQERRKILNLDVPKDEKHTHEHVVRIYTGLEDPEEDQPHMLDDGNTVDATIVESEDSA